jgi:hypothetical protein
MSGPFWRLWGAPIVLGVMTAIGLLSALLGDGVWDAVSAVMLAAPVLVAGWFYWKRPSA